VPATSYRRPWRSPCLGALLLVASLFQVSSAEAATGAAADASMRVELRQGWSLQSSRKVKAGGALLSTRGFDPEGWYAATVPITVLGAQVAAGEFPNAFQGMNLRKIPGTSYPIGINSFANLPMPKDSPYNCAWWYRTEFDVPRAMAGKRLWLHLDGINYRANLWANGRLVATDRELRGAYSRHELDVTAFLRPGESNVIAVETFAPTEKELGINWVDWYPAPADKSMGLWGAVYLTSSGPVSVRHPAVITHLPDGGHAELTVVTELRNGSDAPVEGMVQASVGSGITVEQKVTLQAHESRQVRFTPQAFPALKVKSPKLWWPAEMMKTPGKPVLHPLKVRFSVQGTVSDEAHARFGIREITSEMNPEGYRIFKVNGRRILIRGGGWARDLFMREDPGKLEAQFRYVMDMGLNTVRFEAQFEVDRFFDLADEHGLLVLAGWCCCDIWEKWADWPPGTVDIANQQLRSQALRLRGRPSVIAWMNGSDGPPPAPIEATYAKTLADAAWPTLVLGSAADTSSTVTGPTGMKMTGPYDYEPPSYWLSDERKRLERGHTMKDARHGGAYGFNTETGPGPAIPVLQTLKRMLPEDHLWPVDSVWSYHAAGERFQKMEQYLKALDHTYGKARSLEDFLRKSQAMAYDGERAMFEAHLRNRYSATGVIQWLINSGWPTVYWQLFDYYLYPAGGYFGTKKANEPLHVQYSYDDRSVVVVNNRADSAHGLTVVARVFDLALEELVNQKAELVAGPDSVNRVLTLPPFPQKPGAVYFVKLELRGPHGQGQGQGQGQGDISSNFYWLPAQLSTIDWDATHDTNIAPIKTFEDMTALADLPPVKLTARVSRSRAHGRERVAITLHNPGRGLAFQVHLGVRAAGSTEELLPVLWEDNYLPLLPGETRTVAAEYLEGQSLGHGATAVIDGWNVEPVHVTIE
jgi:exo-1,4-beta-D-glucosaminidase